MPRRTLMLIGVLLIAYLGMVSYLTYQYPEQTGVLMPLTFGFMLIGAAVIGAKLERSSRKRKGVFRALKVFFASYMTAFGAWLLGSVLVLPIFGSVGFHMTDSPAFMYLLFGATVLVAPLMARWLA